MTPSSVEKVQSIWSDGLFYGQALVPIVTQKSQSFKLIVFIQRSGDFLWLELHWLKWR